jgi:hypothetical protein
MQRTDSDGTKTVGLYRTFEFPIENTKNYDNKFTDVELRCAYTSPTGRVINFFGFFDGDGNGGGDATNGNIWKLRFMPDELGEWTYAWSWSDGTPAGQGTFTSVSDGAGKGILRAYAENPRWFAYNGTDPVWLKSYYETGHSSIAQPFEWIAENVYQTLLDRGYNHLQVNWLLPLCCHHQYYHDGPEKSIETVQLYDEGKASSTMRFNVWHMLEKHVCWLNARDVGLHMFLGFDGSQNEGPAWEKLSDSEKDFYVRYVMARLAPFANIAGWNFVWEVPGDRESHELGLARLLQQYDIFEHLRTYEAEGPSSNAYERPEYTFAAVENHFIVTSERDEDRQNWREPWTHHEACLVGYVSGKPVYMSEGNALWRRFWQQRTKATQDDFRRSAWGCATAAASFCWCGHAGEESLVAFGEQGLPFFGDDNPYTVAAKAIDVLTDVMNEEVEFSRMTPQDKLLSGCDSHSVWCLAEPGRQYLVFATQGESFTLRLSAGQYNRNQWIDTKTGALQAFEAMTVVEEEEETFSPPDGETDWILLLRK